MTMMLRLKLLAVAMLSGVALSATAASPQVGETAPGFRLQDQNNQWHELASYHGKWLVLFFYPKADTPGCTTEACAFRDNIFAFEDAGAVVMGISLDDVKSQKEFADKYSLPFPLLSDAERVVAEAYGVLGSFGPMKVAKRHTFLIGPDGTVAKHYAKVNPETHSKEVLADLQGLIGTAEGGSAGSL
jgi:peroxiredoxin Q/BCP